MSTKVSRRSMLGKRTAHDTYRMLLVLVMLFASLSRAGAQNSSAKGVPAESRTGQSTISTYARDKIETVNLANGRLKR